MAEQLANFGELAEAKHRDRPEAPGQLPSHYAPHTPFRLTNDLATFIPPTGQRVGAVALREPTVDKFAAYRALSPSGNLREAAANLFRCLRELDDLGLDLIVAEAVPEVGLGVAIMDRLRRAATATSQPAA
jgi:L-threonylcarbamoyladenylate synthase